VNTPQALEAGGFEDFRSSASLDSPTSHNDPPHASATLEESEASYRHLFESNPHPMWIYDRETLDFLLVNDAAIEHYGYSQEEFLAMTTRDIRPTEDVPSLVEGTLPSRNNGGKCGVWRHRRKSGELIEVEITVHDFHFRGRAARLALIDDITDRRRTEQALRQSEQEQRQLAERLEQKSERLAAAQAVAKVGSWEFDLRTKRVTWSDETYRICGIDPDGPGVSEETFMECVHPDDRDVVTWAYEASLADHTSFAIDHRILTSDGAMKIVHQRCHTTYDAAGNPVRSIGTMQDITEQKQTEQRLTHSLDLLRAVTEGTTDAIYAKDLQGRYLMVNSQGAHFTGKAPDEIIGLDDTHLFSPESAARHRESDRLVIASGEMHVEENVGLAAGVRRVYHSTKGPMRDRFGNIIGVVGISRDITVSKQAEQALQHMMEGARCLLWQAEVEEIGEENLQWTMHFASDLSAQRFIPLHMAEAPTYGDAWYLSRPKEDRERTDRYGAQEVRAGRSYEQEFRCCDRDGILHWLSENVRVEVIGEGKWRCTGICTDITARKQAEEATRAMTRGAQCLLWYAFVKEGPNGLLWDVEMADEEAAQEFFPVDWPAGISYTDAWTRSRLPEDSPIMDATGANALLTGLPGYTNQFRCLRADGEWRWLNESVRVERLEPGRWHCVGVCTDITEQKRAEEERDRFFTAKQEADAANQAKSEFLSRMSHELRTPLNAILGFGQILDKQPLTPLQQESVQYILKGGRHLLDLINEVLDIARVEAGHIDLSLEPIALAEILAEACNLVRPLAAERDIILDANATCAHTHVQADRQRLKQVLINLLSNAIKYNRVGGSVSIHCLPAPNDRIRIAIQDTGPGIALEQQQKLFVPFERLDAVRSGVEGTGLGLALSQRLVTAMGGELTFESVPGEGSTFCIELPTALSPEERLADYPIGMYEWRLDRSTERKATILTIEDNLSNLRLMEVLLRSRPGTTLLAAMQGSIGLDLARQHEPDLILLDLNLPDISGKEVLARLQASAPTRDIPVIVLSADATPAQIERLLKAGAKAYLTKPLDVTEFLHTLDRILPNRHDNVLPDR